MASKIEPAAMYGCVVVPQLATQAAARLRPHLASTTIVVMEGQRPHERVFSLNEKARAMGLGEGMTRIEVDTFTAVHILARSISEERSARAILSEAMSGYTPRFEPRTAASDWECVLDLAGTERLMGDARTLALKLFAHLQRLGFNAAVVMSANADAGISLARSLAWSAFEDKVGVIADSAGQKAISGLDLTVLRLEEEAEERFSTWGIATLGELAALPETALIARMGQAGKQLRLRARGELPHLLEPAVETFSLTESLELEEPVETLEPLLFLLNPMLEQLLLRARERALALAAVTVLFTIEVPTDRELGSASNAVSDKPAAPTYARTIRPAVPTLNRPLLLKMLQLDLEAHPSSGSVRHVTLSAEPGDTSRIQMGLFAPQMPEPTRFEDTHARLVSLVGEQNVGRVRAQDTHSPEAFQLERFMLPHTGLKAPTDREEGTRPSTAIRRLRPPVTVRVNLQGSRIEGFWYESRRFDVLRCYGPWRASGDWWCGQVWSADTWDVAAREVSEGELMICLVAHDLVRNQWQLEGVYD